MPPWLCVIALGSPVVPEENRIHSGCPKGTCSNANPAAGTGGRSISSAQACRRGPPEATVIGVPSGPGTQITCPRLGNPAMTWPISALRS